MQKRSLKQELFILFSGFLISRVIIKLAGVSFGYHALFEYWQYLDVTSLSSDLLSSLWYQHSQPPVFNFLLGIILKCSGNYSFYVMELLFLSITCCNAFLLMRILRFIIPASTLPLAISLIYVLSPATMLFENELFYTTFVSMLLLTAVYFIVRFNQRGTWSNSLGVFGALMLVCLTRSMYHLLWMLVIVMLLLFIWRKQQEFKKILIVALLSVSAVGGWYLKNMVIFDTFAASSWMGINFSRIVFHNATKEDAGNIASVAPFMPISYYKNFISGDYKKKYAGINDRILLMETKNGRFLNMNNAGYLEVSKKYLDACKIEIAQHPATYIKNAITSFIIFFTPASSYFKVAENADRIKYYDAAYSLNPSYFFKDDYHKKQSLVIAALPKFLWYLLTFFLLVKTGVRNWANPGVNIFICLTILFSLTAGSLFDYGENMRFRYEVEPLFLIIAAQAVKSLVPKKT